MELANKSKLILAISGLLDSINNSLEKGETPKLEDLGALERLATFTCDSYHLD